MFKDRISGREAAPGRGTFALQEYLPSAIAICLGTAISVVGFITTHLYDPFGGGYVASWAIVTFVVLFAGWMAQLLVSSQLRGRLVEQSVGERTSQLSKANAALEAEISERNEIEAALRASERRFSSLVSNIPGAVYRCACDEHWTMAFMSDAIEAICGYPATDFVQGRVRTYANTIHPEDRSAVADTVQKAVARKQPFSIEYRVRHADGSLRWAWEKGVGVFDEESRLQWLDGIIFDVTERKRVESERAELERELRQAHKLESLGILAGGIAHEINTPVQYVGDNVRFLRDAVADLETVLKACTGLSKAMEQGGEEIAARDLKAAITGADLPYIAAEMPKSIEESLEGIERISEIVRAIKDFSHPAAKEKTPTDINQIIATTITVARNQWKYVADLETDFDPELPCVPCLAGELNQVILNLIVNAAHAIEETGRGDKGRIVISTRKAGNWVDIRVRDTGCGIAPENRDKVFDPFFTTKEPRKGTGQGLAISHTIVTKKHGGTISFETEAGSGTTFVVRLPLSVSEQPQAAA